MNYRADIDGLRTVAVLIVVLCHAELGFRGGYVGVDVFFVISGYLITRLMLKDFDAGTFSLIHFWERRVRRILPALVVVVATTLVAGWFTLVPATFQSLGRSVVALGGLHANLFFARDTGYFAASAYDKPLLHTWSLAVEEQFYLVVPLLFWGAVRLRRREWIGPVVALASMISFYASVRGVQDGNLRTYYLLTTRAWELFVGVLIALGPREVPALGLRTRNFIAAAALAGILLPCFCYDHNTSFPGLAALPPVLGAAALIVLGGDATRVTWVHRLLSWRPVVLVGLISYSLYLWHWPLIVFLKYSSISSPSVGARLLAVAASMALAIATYRYVEVPFRQRKYLAARPRLAWATGATFACLFAGGLIARHSDNWWPSRLPPQVRALADTCAPDRSFMRNHKAADVPQNLFRLGDDNAAPQLLIWGDSHAQAVLPVLDEMCRRAGIAARGATHGGWAPVLRPCAVPAEGKIEASFDYADALIEYVRTSDIRTVILVGYWRCYFMNPRFSESLLSTVDELQRMGCRVCFMKDVPNYEIDVAAKVVQCAWQGRDTSNLSISLQTYEGQNQHLLETVVPHLLTRGVQLLDPIPVLQARTKSVDLRPFDDAGSFYRDADHLSVYGARVIQPIFVPVIQAIASTHADTRVSSAAEAGTIQPARFERPIAR